MPPTKTVTVMKTVSGKARQQSKPRKVRMGAQVKLVRKGFMGEDTTGGLATEGVKSYLDALTNPFSDAADGCRVPEPYEVLTRCTKNVSLYQLSPSGNTFTVGSVLQGPGFMSGVISPSANFTLAYNNAATAGNNMTVGGGQTYTVAGAGSANWIVRGNVGQTYLAATYETYRMVSMGIRFKTNMSYTQASGRIVIAIVPSVNQFPVSTNPGVTDGVYASLLNAPWDNSINQVSADILSLPTAQEYSITDLLAEGGVEVRVPLTSPIAKQFLTTDQGGEQGLVTVGASGSAVNFVGNTDFSSTGGFSNVLFFVDGMTVNTSLTLEIVQHFEGIPKLTDGNGTSGILVDQSVRSNVGPPQAAEMCAQVANSRPVQCLVSKLLAPVRRYSDRKGGNTKAAINAGGQLAKVAVGKLAGKMLGLFM